MYLTYSSQDFPLAPLRDLMFRVLVVAFAVSCLAPCGWAQTQPAPAAAAPAQATKPPAKKPAAKKTSAKPVAPADNGPCQIGVISDIGDQFVVQNVGFTVFGNERSEVPTKGWGLDDLVIARVRAAAGPGVTVRRIAYAKDAFAELERPGSFFRDMKAELSNAVRQIASGSNCERYVLVQRSMSRFSNLNQSVRGIGVVHWVYRTFLFALSHVRIYDGQSFEVIKQSAAATDDEPLVARVLMSNPIRGPNRELDKEAFPSNPAEATSNPAFRDGARALLTTSLDNILPAMLRP
jgi:hypothetical protein